MLEIHTLGELSITQDGQPLEFATRKVEALLVYLACAGRPCPREVLAELLWQDRSQAQSQANFRAALSRLNQHLAAYLTVTRQTVELNLEHAWLDVAQLQAGLRAENWDDALALYRGDFLAGFSVRDSQGFDDWVLLERERLKIRVIEALDTLTRRQLDRGEYAGGIARCQQLLQLDPWREDIHARLMRLWAASGQRTAALAQYEACRSILAADLAVEPGAELTSLHRQIQAGEWPPAVEREASRVKFINPLPHEAGTRYIGNAPRLAELANALSGEARLVSVYGRGGVGKTALVCKVLSELSSGIHGVVSLSALKDDIRLDRILADFGRLLGGPAGGLLDAAARDGQLTASQKTSVLLEQLRGGRYVVLLDNLETLQDATTGELTDPGVQTFIEMAVAQSSALCVLITSREPLALSRPLKTWERLLLLADGLAVDEAVALLRACDPAGAAGLRDAPAETLQRLAAAVHGFPRALEAAAGFLLENPLLDATDLLRDQMLVADEITSAIVQQAIARLDPAALRVLEVLAVLERPASQAAIEYCSAPYVATAHLPPLLNRLVRSFFIRFDKTTREFSLHPIDQAYCYHRLADRDGDDARIKLHQRAADFFAHQRLPIGRWQTIEDVSPQLQEFDQRVKAGEYDLAAEVLATIDRDYLWEWNQNALLAELHGHLQGHLTDAALARASRRRLGWTHWPDVQQAAPIFEQNLSEARQAGDRQAEADALDDLAQVNRFQMNMAQALELHEQALGLYRAIGDRRGEGEALGGAAQALMGTGQIERALAYNEQALAIQRALNHQPSIGFLLGAQGTLYNMLGQFERAIACYTAAIGVYGELNAQRGIASHLALSAFVYANLGQFEQALECVRRAAGIARALHNAEAEVMTQMLRGIALVLRGDAAEAIEALQLALAPEVHNMVTRGFASHFLVMAQVMTGQIAGARELRATMPPWPRPTPTLAQKVLDGLIAARLGEADSARMTFQAALDYAAQLPPQAPNRYEVPYWRGLANAGLALLNRSDAHLTVAQIEYAIARETCAAAGIVSLHCHLLDALLVCPGGEFLQAARAALDDQPA